MSKILLLSPSTGEEMRLRGLQIFCSKRQMMNWDCSLSNSKAQSLDCHARNAKESSPTGSNVWGGREVDDPMGVEHCITSPVQQKQGTGFQN